MENMGRRESGKAIIQKSSGVIDQLNITQAFRVRRGIYAWSQQ